MLYDKNAGVVITIMEVKEKFLPVTQYIKPAVLRHIKEKKENRKMKKLQVSTCPDCGQTGVEITSQGICKKCRQRKINAGARGKEYIPYINLPEERKRKIDTMQKAQEYKKETCDISNSIKIVDMPIVKPKMNAILDNNRDLILTLRNCGCKIPDVNLKEVLNVLTATDKLKDLLMTITTDINQQALLDLEQSLNVAERKLQHDWEYNGFQEADDLKFKNFLMCRRTLKGAIYFWKKLYSTNTIVELKKAWDLYNSDPSEKSMLTGDRNESIMKRYQITTETISTIYNTKRPFTRVFYAISEEDAKEKLAKWLADRQLHEDKSKTSVIELTTDVKSEVK